MGVKILQGMGLLDAAIVASGSAEDLFAFARLNGYGYTDQPPIGATLEGTGNIYFASVAPSIAHLTTKPVNVLNGQTLADLAIQQLGSIEAVFALARLNGLNVTDDLSIGQVLSYSLTPYDKQVFKLYSDRQLKPASGGNIPGQTQPDKLEGIDYWIIQNDFIVS